MTQDIYSEKQNGKQIRYAGLLVRFAACVIDSFLITSIAILIAVLIAGIAMITGPIFGDTILAVNVVAGTLLFFIAPSIFESSVYQATPGKKCVGLKVIDEDGKRISFESACARNIGKLITVILLPFVFPFSILLILSIILTKDRKALHDFSCNTFVVYDY